jgi:hypothetical protein
VFESWYPLTSCTRRPCVRRRSAAVDHLRRARTHAAHAAAAGSATRVSAPSLLFCAPVCLPWNAMPVCLPSDLQPIVVRSRRLDHLGGSSTPLQLREARAGIFDACPVGDDWESEAGAPHCRPHDEPQCLDLSVSRGRLAQRGRRLRGTTWKPRQRHLKVCIGRTRAGRAMSGPGLPARLELAARLLVRTLFGGDGGRSCKTITHMVQSERGDCAALR